MLNRFIALLVLCGALWRSCPGYAPARAVTAANNQFSLKAMLDLHWVLLPPFIRQRLSAKADSLGVLPVNLAGPLIQALLLDTERQERLFRTASDILDHIQSDSPGWGDWPTDIADALCIGTILGRWIETGIEERILELSEEDLARADKRCQAQGLSLEQYVIERLIERVESTL
jgi:hypothetical protein